MGPVATYLRFSVYSTWQNPRHYQQLTRVLFSSRSENYEKYGLPQSHLVIRKSFFTVGLNKTYTPEWVYECLTPNMVVGPTHRHKKKYQTDPDLPPTAQLQVKGLRGSNFVRGHLAAAANYKFSRIGMCETFFLSNIIPQDTNLNSGLWLTIEKTVRTWLYVLPTLHVMTGPLYDSNHEDPKQIAIPGYLFKVILGEKHDGELIMKAFLVANRSFPKGTSQDQFITTVERVERATGLILFPKLDSEKRLASQSIDMLSK